MSGRFFDILHDDMDLIVVDKHPGVLTVPTHGRESNTLVSLVERYLRLTPPRRLYTVHRLDRETSGALLFAKSRQAADLIESQFAAHKADRKYLLIVEGVIKAEGGTFRSYLATDKDLNQRAVSAMDGVLAVTHYRVLHRGLGCSVVEATLETGKRNQIRVHFADAGHPLLGDLRYGTQATGNMAGAAFRQQEYGNQHGKQHDNRHGNKHNHKHGQKPPYGQRGGRAQIEEAPIAPRIPTTALKHWPADRLALHAHTLGVEHPHSKAKMLFTAPIPDVFQKLITLIQDAETKYLAAHPDTVPEKAIVETVER